MCGSNFTKDGTTYKVVGNKSHALIFIHGVGIQSDVWQPQIEYFSHLTSANLSSDGLAKVIDIWRWLCERILIAKDSACVKDCLLEEFFPIQISIRCGLRDTEVKELAVKPMGLLFLSIVVTTVTPVGKEPSALLKSLLKFCILFILL